MSNYKFKLLIKPESLYNKLIPEQRQQFSSVEITKATLFENGTVELDCLALDSETIETPYCQILLDDSDFICVEQLNDIYKDAGKVTAHVTTIDPSCDIDASCDDAIIKHIKDYLG